MAASPVASDMLLSLSALLRDETQLVEDWSRLGADCRTTDDFFERGVRLLYCVEKARRRRGNLEPLRTMDVAKGFIVGEAESGDRVYLTLLNDDSDRFQLIGGAVREGEDFETAMRRELIEELPRTEFGADSYTLKPLKREPADETFISPTYGRLTHYRVQYYQIGLSQPPVLSQNHRWVTHDEFVDSKTRDGYKIIPDRSDLPFSTSELLNMPRSFAQPVAPSPMLPKRRHLEAEGQGRQSVLVPTVCFVVLLVVVAGVLIAASRLTAAHYFFPILATTILILIAGAAFVARGAGWIEAGDMTTLFRDVLGRARPPDPSD